MLSCRNNRIIARFVTDVKPKPTHTLEQAVKVRIASGIVAYVGFCALVAAVQNLMGAPFWVAFGLDAAGVAALMSIFMLLTKAIEGKWMW